MVQTHSVVPGQSRGRMTRGGTARPEMAVRVYTALHSNLLRHTRGWSGPLVMWQVAQQWWLNRIGLC